MGEAEPRHQLTRMVKARQVAEFGKHSDSRGELHTAHGLQAQDGRIELPVCHCLAQGGFNALALCESNFNRASKFLKRELLPFAAERILAHPAWVGRSPVGMTGIAHIVREQDRLQPLSRLP